MRTAVLLSGQIRSAGKSFYSINNCLIKNYDADVFISTWIPTPNLLSGLGQYIEDDVGIDKLLELYQPTNICIEDFNKHENQNPIPSHKLQNKHSYDGSWIDGFNFKTLLYQHYRRQKGFALIEQHQKLNNFKYDCVIVSRFDVTFKEYPIIKPEPNKIYIPVGPNADSPIYHHGGIRDLYAMGDFDVMKIYCELYEKLYCYHDSGYGLHPESILRTHLELNQIEVHRFHISSRIRDREIL